MRSGGGSRCRQQATLKGTEKASGARRSTAHGPTATHGPLMLLDDHRSGGCLAMPWFLPFEKKVGSPQA